MTLATSAPPIRSQQDTGRGRPLDARLLIPALTAWVATAALLNQPAPVLITCAAVSATGGIAALLRARRRHGRSANAANNDRYAIAALTLIAVATVLVAAAGHQSIRTAGPIIDLAEQRASATITARVVTQARIIERPGLGGDHQGQDGSSEGDRQVVVLRIQVTEVEARGLRSVVNSPVLMFADQSWSGLGWRHEFTVSGRLTPAEPGGDVIAVFSPWASASAEDHGAMTADRGPVLAASDRARERLHDAVDPLPADARGLIPGLVIGDTSLTPPDLTEAMLNTGMTHLSAVSGANVAIVVGAVLLICIAVGVPRRLRPVIAAVAIIGFVILCRPEPSVLRAGTMGLIGLIALSTHRRHMSVPALCAAILILLGIDPFHARSYGFVLSCLATLGLVLFARPWGEAIAARLPAGLGWLGYALSIPLSAQVMCGPVIVLLQEAVLPVSVLTNLLAAPLVAPTTIAGIVAALAAMLWVPLGVAAAWVGAGPAWLLGQIARWGETVPAGRLDWIPGATGAWLLTAMTAVVVFCGPWLIWQTRRRPGAVVVAAVLVVAVAAPLPSALRPIGDWVVAGCDVGQGDAFLVRSGPASAVVIDTGPDPALVADCLQHLRISEVDAVVLTHFDADHVGGLDGVLQVATVRSALLPGYVDDRVRPAADAVRAELETHDVPMAVAEPGQRWEWGGVHAVVLWPDDGAARTAGRSPANNASVVLDVTVGELRGLFLGDIEAGAGSVLRRTLAGETFDLVKIAHHGSADHDPGLLRGIDARVAMIGVGADNTFGHPAPSVLDVLDEQHITVLRTDQHGLLTVRHDGEGGAGLSYTTQRRIRPRGGRRTRSPPGTDPVLVTAGTALNRRTRATGSRPRARHRRRAGPARTLQPPRPGAGVRPVGRAIR